MNWHKDRGPRGYHHGNLKEALIRAALDLIAEKGPSGFTFAEAARFAGVSPAAPYRHFRDRDELLASVALRGFAQFEAALAQAWNEGAHAEISGFDRAGYPLPSCFLSVFIRVYPWRILFFRRP